MALQMTGSWFIYHWHQEGRGCLRPVWVEKLGYVMMAIVSSARRRNGSCCGLSGASELVLEDL